MKRRTLFAAAAGIVAAPALHAQPREVVLGLSMVKSGPLKSPGEATETAVDIAIGEINAGGGIAGRQVRLIKFDTGSDPRQAATAVQKFARDDNALAVIGPFSSGEAAVAFPVGERLGIVQVSTSSSAPGLTGSNTYAWRMTEDEGKQFGRLLTSLQRKNIPAARAEIIFISDERVSAITATQFYPPLLRERGIAFGEPVSFQYRSFDIAPQVTQILQRQPQVVALAATPDGAGKVLRELRRQGFRGRVIGSQIFADPNSVELFGPEGDGMLIVAGFWWDRNDATRAFTVKYREENVRRGLPQKKIPHHSDAQAYDTAFLLKQAMERAGITGDPARLAAERTAIRDALQGIRFTGVTGENTCFDAARDAELPGFIVEIRNQEWSLFDQFPADACS
ncbi:ABC transporter substrate-binding protein [Falsiroseomonas sp. HW251]|uniref:ABC transporter substrate-binding protein n=1 Tax=Falsiroseomonas sp. HW251 TaxID=3390998 RepID=UPI003D316FAE